MQQFSFFDRDISWLSFNQRVLMEAANDAVPLLERISFLSIYSSNLDEFYRVRIPALMALKTIKKVGEETAQQVASLLQQAVEIVNNQQQQFGDILTQHIIPSLAKNNIDFIYKQPIPEAIQPIVDDYFFTQLLGFLQPIYLDGKAVDFFPGNNKLYIAVLLEKLDGSEQIAIVNIPSDEVPRFFSTTINGKQFILFIDDIIKQNLSSIFKNIIIKNAFSIKITRDAELDLQDDYDGDIAEKMEKQIAKRDFGFATRFLYQPSISPQALEVLISSFKLDEASVVQGGVYHNLRDLSAFPAKASSLSYEKWPGKRKPETGQSLFEQIAEKDRIIHTPYQSYDPVLRFFNEAAIDENVQEIYLTMYRMAQDSKIAAALISASKNGKKVSVFIELKARFDEANNLKWAKRMKEAGIKIIYSIPALKVHAKVALVKKKQGDRMAYYGLFSTGNLNEGTARFYTDHVLLTTNHAMVRELELLFIFLAKRKKPQKPDEIVFNHLLVAQFNLQTAFLAMIDREIAHAKNGEKAAITIKLNNLEEQVLISKLYEASNAGVTIQLIVRSICCLVPGIVGMSERISVRRIVDRYLEHGRVFIFHNNGKNDTYLGSADWMNRNIYRRIEVCFPVYDAVVKQEIWDIIQLQLKDNTQAVNINQQLENMAIITEGKAWRSQQSIYEML